MNKKICSLVSVVLLIFSLCAVPTSAQQEKLVLSEEGMIRLLPREQDGYLDLVPTDSEGNEVNLFSEENYAALPMTLSEETLPESYDLRNVGGVSYVTSVKDQEETKWCWAFAALGAAESNILKQNMAQEKWFTNDELRFSPLHLGKTAVTEKKGIEGLEGDYLTSSLNGSRAGNDMIAAASLSAGVGVQLEAEAPFSQRVYGLDEAQYGVSYYHLKDYSCLLFDRDNPSSDANALKRSILKQWVMENGACTVGYCYSSADMYQNETVQSLYHSEKGDVNHASLIVGWDDNFSAFDSANKPAQNGAWLIRNSHGTGNNVNGYFWLSYYDATIQIAGSVCMENADSYDNHYQYAGVASFGGIQAGESLVSEAANVFTAKSAETLKAVGVFTLTEGVGYEVKVYRGITEGGPESGTLCETLTGTFTGSGYHSVPLETAVSLSAGETFSVVVSLTGENAYMPFECYGTKMYDEEVGVGCREGETYVSAADAWYDVMNVTNSAGNLLIGNAPIHALTVNETQTEEKKTALTAAVTTAENRYGSRGTTKPLSAETKLWKQYLYDFGQAKGVLEKEDAQQFELHNAERNLQSAVNMLQKTTPTMLKYENNTVTIDSVKHLGEVLLVAARYKGDTLQGVLPQKVTLTGAVQTLDLSTQFSPQTDETVKIMLWSDWDSLKPLAACAE